MPKRALEYGSDDENRQLFFSPRKFLRRPINLPSSYTEVSRMSRGHINKNVQTYLATATTTQANAPIITLTAGQAGTLDGIRGNIDINPKGVACSLVMVIRHARQDRTVTIATPSSSFAGITDGPEVDILWSFIISFNSTALEPVTIPIEIKTKRKFMAGDVLYLSHKSNAATSADITANLATFFRI